MYEKLTLKEKGNVPAFIQAIVERCSDVGSNLNFFRRLSDGIISASALPPSIRNRNQCIYEEGKSRWCSELLTDLASFITGSARLHCHAAGAEGMGFDRRDIRGIHAVAVRTIMMHFDYRIKIRERTARMSSAHSQDIYECYDQFRDYLEYKAKSRVRVKEATDGYILVPGKQVSYPSAPPATVGYTGPITAREMELQQLQRDIADKLIDQLQKPGINVTDLHALAAAQQFIKQERLATQSMNMVAPYGSKDTVHESASVFAALSGNKLPTIDLSKGNDTMSLGVPISPFNFNKPAIESIRFVYGISVKELNVERITHLLTDRQAEVDRLKALPHKPEVIKAKIATLKGEIKELLALANELFPVAE